MKYNIYDDTQVIDCLNYASGTAPRSGDIIDVSGFEGLAIIVKFAAIAASGTNTIKMEAGDASDLSDKADITGTLQSIAVTDDNEIRVIDIKKPTFKYWRLVVTKDATNACAESAVAILYGARVKPTTVASDVGGESFTSPVAGTA